MFFLTHLKLNSYVGWIFNLYREYFLLYCNTEESIHNVLHHQLNSTSQNYCMGAKSSNIFICPKRILEKSRAKIYKSKALEVHKHLMYINKKFSEHRCCSTNAKRKVRTKKKRKWRSRSLAGQRLVKVSSSKKKKKRKKKGRSKKSSKKKCRRRKNKKSCKKN